MARGASTDPGGAGAADIDALFGSLGDLGRDLRAVDWAATPLGVPAGWPQSLKSSLQVMLTSRFSMWMAWGPELTFFANEAYCRATLGGKYPWALGRPAAEVWSEIWVDIGPRINRVLHTGVASWDESLFLILERSGYPEESYHTFSYSPLADETGTIVGMLCVVSEDTSRVVAERRMRIVRDLGLALGQTRTEDEIYATVARELATDLRKFPFALVYRLDEDRALARLVSASGTTPGDPIAPLAVSVDASNGSWPLGPAAGGSMVVVDDLAERFATVPRGAWTEPARAAVLLPLTPAGGRPVGILVAALNRYRPFDRNYEGFLKLIATEIAASIASARAYESERERAEALIALDQAKTAFLTNVSHEFRTPLTLMLGPLEDAIDAIDAIDAGAGSGGAGGGAGALGAAGPADAGARARADQDQRERLEMVQRNGRRLLRMVNALLDFARFEAGQTEVHPVPTDLGARTAEIAASFADICRRAGLDLVLDCPPVVASVDIEAWETILLNLLSNAFKFTFSGSIRVQVRASGPDSATVVVADTGTGIAAADLARIFERFYRPSHATGRSAEGSGIGLALVRSLIERHQGSIDIASELGRGTTVSIRLPVPTSARPGPLVDRVRPVGSEDNAYVAEARQWLAGGPPAGSDPGVASRSGRPVVLVADDNQDMRRQLARVLGARFDVVMVNDGEQALAHIRRDRPDLVVTDVMMPILDGFGLVRAIRADPELSTLPVLMLSARAGGEAAGEGFDAGADDYVVKPFRSADLLARATARIEAVRRSDTQVEAEQIVARRAAALGELGIRLGRATELAAVLQAMFEAPLVMPAAAWAAVGVVERSNGLIRLTFHGAFDPLMADRYHVIALDADLPLAEVVRRNATRALSDRLPFDEGFEQELPGGTGTGHRSITMPVRDRDHYVIGALTLGWAEAGTLEPVDVAQLEQATGLVSSAVERIRIFEREHRLATDLQQRLLDFEVTSEAAAVYTLYQPAGEEARVGGDWYTATALDGDDRVAVSVGDMAGHGLPATAAMGQLRSALEATALTTPEPGRVVDVIARYAATLPEQVYATLAYAIVDRRAGEVSYSCAGHPYPVVVGPDATVRFLDQGRRPMLGTVAASSSAPSATAAFPMGSLLLMYTDGLIERRGESLDTGLARLARAAAGLAHASTGEACQRLVRDLAPAGGFSDDVAMVAVRLCGSARTSFVEVLAAGAEEIRPIRRRLRSWLAELGIDAVRAYEILLGVGEAVNNAVEHGSEFDRRRRVTVEAFADRDRVTVSVSDRGSWQWDTAASGRYANRGKGLTLMHGVSDGVEIVRDGRGTRVTLVFNTTAAVLGG